MFDRIFGWHKDIYDDRDYIFMPKRARIPTAQIWREFVPAIRDQGNVGSCVAWGIGGNLVAKDKWFKQFIEWYSATYIYNGARYLDGTLTQDVGTQPRSALHWLYMKGCLLESLWPYDPEKLDTTPPPSRLELEAAKHPLLAYYRVTSGVDGIRAALAEGRFVSIGTPWFNEWMHPEHFDGNLEEVSTMDTVAGGHETCLHGYDDAIERVHGFNSWSEDWGNGGLFTMPYDAFDIFKKKGGYDAHYIGWKAASEEAEETEESTCKWAKRYVGIGNFFGEKVFHSETSIPAPIRRIHA